MFEYRSEFHFIWFVDGYKLHSAFRWCLDSHYATSWRIKWGVVLMSLPQFNNTLVLQCRDELHRSRDSKQHTITPRILIDREPNRCWKLVQLLQRKPSLNTQFVRWCKRYGEHSRQFLGFTKEGLIPTIADLPFYQQLSGSPFDGQPLPTQYRATAWSTVVPSDNADDYRQIIDDLTVKI